MYIPAIAMPANQVPSGPCWVEVFWFDCWTTAWCSEVNDQGIVCYIANDSYRTFFPFNRVRALRRQM